MINHPCSKILQASPLSTRQGQNALLCHTKHAPGLVPTWLLASPSPLLSRFTMDICTSLPGAASPPVLHTHHILKGLVQL